MVLTVQKPVEIPQVHVVDNNLVDMLVCCATTGAIFLTVQNPMEIPLLQALDKVVGMPVVVQRQVSTVQTVQKPAEISQLPTVDKVLTCPLLCNDRCP